MGDYFEERQCAIDREQHFETVCISVNIACHVKRVEVVQHNLCASLAEACCVQVSIFAVSSRFATAIEKPDGQRNISQRIQHIHADLPFVAVVQNIFDLRKRARARRVAPAGAAVLMDHGLFEVRRQFGHLVPQPRFVLAAHGEITVLSPWWLGQRRASQNGADKHLMLEIVDHILSSGISVFSCTNSGQVLIEGDNYLRKSIPRRQTSKEKNNDCYFCYRYWPWSRQESKGL